VIFCCPHCGEPLEWRDSFAACANNHTFDRAREGYLNLLVGGRLPSSGTPGDTAESLQARRRFLNGGWYSPIATALADALGAVDGDLLDVGCGEGWYLSTLTAQQKNGLDISKRAVQMTSKLHPDGRFVVGSAHRLPVLSGSCAAVFSVFSPHSLDEFRRVLTPNGRWVTVTPGPRQIEEMRPNKNESTRSRESRRTEPPAGAASADRLTFELTLTAGAAVDLFTMTPLQWQSAAAAAPADKVTIDVWVARGDNT
jgi:23S rRNA (guanine745-N1)-methyltransferase